MRWISRVVTIVTLVGVLVAAYVLLRHEMPQTHVGGHFHTYARFRDGSRLAVGSPVMIAGVRVGEVSALTVEGEFARVDMELRDDTDIPVDSWITKKAESAFGDSYLEIIPFGGEGAAPARRLRDGEPITHVIEGGSTDTALRAIARTMPKIDRGLDAVHDFALSTRKWANGPFEDAIERANRWLAEDRIGKPIDNADRAMARLESGTARAADAVASAKPEVPKTLDRIDRGIASARQQMKDIKTGLHDGLANARDGIDRVDPTIDDMRDYLAAVNEGRGNDFKGRLGRLVNDRQPGDDIANFTEDARETFARLDPFRSWLGFRGEWNVFSGVPRVYVTAELRARNDKFYLLELEKDGMGGIPSDQITDVLNAQQWNRYTEITESIRFTAQFGKRFGPLQLRGGLKESTFGIGADLLLNQGSLRFSADVFGGFSYTPRVKLAAAMEVFKQFYILAGVDDALNAPRFLPIETGNTQVPTYFNELRFGRDYFVGGMMQFTDADLALLVRVYGAMIIGLL